MIQNKMTLDELVTRLQTRPDEDEFVSEVLENTEIIPLLFNIIQTDKGNTKFFCNKVVQIISEKQPKLIYPYFDDVACLIHTSNSFIKWGAIITLSNLIAVDKDNKFEAIYKKYFNLIDSDSMITAANVIGNAWKIIKKNPIHENDITQRMLRITENTYLNKGKPSPECTNVLIGHVIDCFDKYYDVSSNKESITDFVIAQTDNPRPQVSKKAKAFLKKHESALIVSK